MSRHHNDVVMIRILKLSFIAQFIFWNFGCTSVHKKFTGNLEKGNCEAAAELIPEEKDVGLRLLGRVDQAGGTLFSYAFTGASYTTEVVLDFLGGTVMVVALCAPMFVAGVYAQQGTRPNSSPVGCLPGRINALRSPALGRKAYQSSKDWRCPNVTPLSQSIRQVASCFENRGQVPSLETAQKSLLSLQTEEAFYSCLTSEEKLALDQQISGIKKKLAL